MLTFYEFLEGKRLTPFAAKKWENLPTDVKWETISGWRVLFHNAEQVPEDQFEQFKNIDRPLITKVLNTLMSIGVRKHNRIPILVTYSNNRNTVGAAYKSADDYLKVIRDMSLSPEQMVGTFAHEIGHAIYNKLPEDVYDTIRAKSREIGSFTKYTDPNMVPSGFMTPPEGHESGNEWFADYVAALTMKSLRLPDDTPVADWQPNSDKQTVNRGMTAAKQILGQQVPGKNAFKSAARYNQKWKWLLQAAYQIVRWIFQYRTHLAVARLRSLSCCKSCLLNQMVELSLCRIQIDTFS